MQFLFSRQFHHFRVVYEMGSIGIAATTIGVTQPALSKSLKLLEQKLTTSLFDRTPAGVVPTKPAILLYQHVRNMERQARYAEIEVGGLLAGAGGSIKLGVGLIWSQRLIPKILAKFNKVFPNIHVEVENSISDVLLPRLFEGSIDMVICEVHELEIPDNFTVGETWNTERGIWVRKDHPLTKLDIVSWKDVVKYDWIGHAHERHQKSSVNKTFANRGIEPPKIAIEISSLATLLATVAECDLVAVVAMELQEEAFTKGLVRLQLFEKNWGMTSGVVYRKEISQIRPYLWIINEVTGLLHRSGVRQS